MIPTRSENLFKSSDNQTDAILGAVNAGITFVPTHLDETTSYLEVSMEMQAKVRIRSSISYILHLKTIINKNRLHNPSTKHKNLYINDFSYITTIKIKFVPNVAFQWQVHSFDIYNYCNAIHCSIFEKY